MTAVDIDAELKKRKEARDARLREIKSGAAVPTVKVVPSKEEYRKYLKHGVTGVGFTEQGSVEWPNDQFTKRRIRDGSVALEQDQDKGAKAGSPKPSSPQ